MTFHWLSCDSLSLAELLPDKKKSFLPSARVVKYMLLPVENARYVSACLQVMMEEWWGMRDFPFGSVTPF